MSAFYIIGILLGIWYCRKKEVSYVFALALIAPISTFIQGQGDAHHMVPTYATASILAGAGITEFVRNTKSQRAGEIGFMVLFLLLFIRGLERLPSHRMIRAWVHGDPLEEIYGMQKRAEMDVREELAVGQY